LKVILAVDKHRTAREVYEHCKDYLYYALPAKAVGRHGCDGYVIPKGTNEVIPIKVLCETVEDFEYIRKNQTDLWTTISAHFVWQNRDTNPEFIGDFMMFHTSGWPGRPKWWGAKKKEGGEPLSPWDAYRKPEEGEGELPELHHIVLYKGQYHKQNTEPVPEYEIEV
jgi:hypothetical protein